MFRRISARQAARETESVPGQHVENSVICGRGSVVMRQHVGGEAAEVGEYFSAKRRRAASPMPAARVLPLPSSPTRLRHQRCTTDCTRARSADARRSAGFECRPPSPRRGMHSPARGRSVRGVLRQAPARHERHTESITATSSGVVTASTSSATSHRTARPIGDAAAAIDDQRARGEAVQLTKVVPASLLSNDLGERSGARSAAQCPAMSENPAGPTHGASSAETAPASTSSSRHPAPRRHPVVEPRQHRPPSTSTVRRPADVSKRRQVDRHRQQHRPSRPSRRSSAAIRPRRARSAPRPSPDRRNRSA